MRYSISGNQPNNLAHTSDVLKTSAIQTRPNRIVKIEQLDKK